MNFYSSSIITALITTTHERIVSLLPPGPCAGEARRAPGTTSGALLVPPNKPQAVRRYRRKPNWYRKKNHPRF